MNRQSKQQVFKPVRVAPAVAMLLLVAGFVGPASAASLNTLDLLSQSQFKTLSENIGAATHYRAITPAEPLGLIGFDVGISVTSTSLDEDIFDLASAGDYDLGQFILPRLSVHKGLPWGIDLGASFTGAPGTDFRIIGAEVRKALLEGGLATPAVAVRLSYSQLSGADEIEVNNLAADVSVSKGFAMFTPYAGIGLIRTESKAIESNTLDDESFSQSKLFAGINVNFGMNFVFEVDRVEDYSSISLKTGLRF